MVRTKPQREIRKNLGCLDCYVRLKPNRFTKIRVCERCRILRLRDIWNELSGIARAFGWEQVLNG
jgi:NMD protein affecting ribosome stability and mRNA decay